MEQAFFGAGLAMLVSAGLVRALQGPATRLGWVDQPDGFRKRHGRSVPLTGGIAMCLAIVAALSFAGPSLSTVVPLAAAMLALTLAGACDDRFDIKAPVRLGIHVITVWSLCTWTDVRLTHLGALFGGEAIHLPGWAQLPFTVFAIVGVINAVNMIDGVDGLAGGLAIVVLSILAWLMVDAGQLGQAAVLLILIGAVAGFLLYNLRSPWRSLAAAFMGDAGSTLLGLMLGWHLVVASQAPVAVVSPAVALWLLAIPLIDTIRLMVERMRAGRSPFAADHGHLHHILRDRGWSDGRITAAILTSSLAFGLGALLAWRLGVSERTFFLVFIGLFAVSMMTIRPRAR